MKVFRSGLLSLTLLALLVSCGKENKSGQSSWNYANPYTNGYGPTPVTSSPYQAATHVMSKMSCMSSYGNMQGRIPIQIPLTGFQGNTPIAPGEQYVGVTSSGDVAVVVGTGINQPPLFIAYICPRSFAPQGQGQLMGVKLGMHSRCIYKPITAATIVLPGNIPLNFRWLDGGMPVASGMGGQFNIVPFPVDVCPNQGLPY